MRIHRMHLRIQDGADVDHRAEAVARPALRLHRERLDVLRERGHERREPIDELGRRDEPVATLRVPVRTELGLVPLDAGQLDGLQRALAGSDVVRMAVAAVRSPDDHDLGPHQAEPADDVADDPLLVDIGQAAVGVSETRDTRQAHAASRFRELLRTRRSHELARNDLVVDAGPALLALREAKAVDLDPVPRVPDQRAASSERLVVGMCEHRRELQSHGADDTRGYARPVSGTARIVVVEDDASVAELVTLYLRNAGYIVEHAATGERARALFDEVKPALVVLDLGLPDTDGIELFNELRGRADTPVIALTARAEDAQRIAGIDAGMDDYLAKPFNPRELVSRVRAILRRASAMPGGGRVLRVGNVSVDPARHEVLVGERAVALRAKEFELLEAFCR